MFYDLIWYVNLSWHNIDFMCYQLVFKLNMLMSSVSMPYVRLCHLPNNLTYAKCVVKHN